MGSRPASSVAIFVASTSTPTTSFPLSARHVAVTNPTYPVPMIAIFMFRNPCLQEFERHRDSRGVAGRDPFELAAAPPFTRPERRWPRPGPASILPQYRAWSGRRLQDPPATPGLLVGPLPARPRRRPRP